MRPFVPKRSSFLRSALREISSLLAHRKAARLIIAMVICLLSLVALFSHCITTNSMALTAFSYLIVFDFLSLLVSWLSIWVSQQKPNFSYSFGYERFEVLAVFTCTTLAQLGGFFIFKESLERVFEPQEVQTHHLITMVCVGVVIHIIVTFGVDNPALRQVSAASSSNWMQNIMIDIGKSLCGILPGLSRVLLRRVNPYTLLSEAAALIVIIEVALVEFKDMKQADTFAAMSIAILIFVTMMPLSIHSAMILLQATPIQLMSSIDKCLKESITLDGVLEMRNEHFWTVSFNNLAGSMHVRVRRDANDQLILAELSSRLSPYLQHLTIQIYKEDWSRPLTSFQTSFTNSMNLQSPMPSQHQHNSTKYSTPSGSLSIDMTNY